MNKNNFLGDCDYDAKKCSCSEEELSFDEDHHLCITPQACGIYCQFKGKSTGNCEGPNGWDCVCVDKDDENEIAEEAGEDEARDIE